MADGGDLEEQRDLPWFPLAAGNYDGLEQLQTILEENGVNEDTIVNTFIRAGIFKKSMGARHRVGIGLSYRPARLHRLAELMPWNRFLGSPP
jgi:hypothetical protein